MTYKQNPLSYQAPEKAGPLSRRQEEIISKTSKLLSKKGSQGLTIKNLAKEMKFSEAALYRHFSSKEKIVVALLENLIFQLDKLFLSIDKEMPASHRYQTYFNSLFIFFEVNRDLVDVTFSEGIFEKTQETTEALNGVSSIMNKHLIPIVMAGKLSGDFPMELNAERIIHILIGTFRLQMQKWSLSNYSFDVVLTGNDVMGILLPLFKR
jgi:AcrR family transcriptional regulator